MENSEILKYSSSPHIKAPHDTGWIMINVCLALLPACVMGVVFFGLRALLVLALSTVSAVLSEWIFLLIGGKKFDEIIREFDFTSCVTGLLVGMTIGTNYPLYAPVLGSAFAIIVVKMLFGGTGKNVVNPAIVGRIFIFISFQSVVTEWLAPSIGSLGGSPVTSGATVLAGLLDAKSPALPSLSGWDLLLGTGLSGCIGETCKLALLIGAVYLAVRGIIKIQFPVICVAVSSLFTVALNGFDFAFFIPSALSGGLILGAFFMATDYVTTPNTETGNYVYFVLLGLLIAGLRQATHMETVSFAILLMNLLVPLIDKFVVHRPFGYVRPAKKEGDK